MFFSRKNKWKVYWKKLVVADKKLPELLHQEIHGNFIHQLRHTERIVTHLFTNWDKRAQLNAEIDHAKEDMDNYENQMKLMRSHKDIHSKSIATLKLKRKQVIALQKRLRKTSKDMNEDITDYETLAHTQITRLQNEARLVEHRVNLLRDHLIRNQKITTRKHAKIFDKRYKQALRIIKGLLKF